MGTDKGLWHIGAYSKQGVAVGAALGAVLLALSLWFIRYTDQLFLVLVMWIAALPFVLWVVKKARSGKPPDQRGGADGV